MKFDQFDQFANMDCLPDSYMDLHLTHEDRFRSIGLVGPVNRHRKSKSKQKPTRKPILVLI